MFKSKTQPEAQLLTDAKPCPFCGQSQIVQTKAQKLFYVGCFPCCAFVVTDTPAESLRIWNTRAFTDQS